VGSSDEEARKRRAEELRKEIASIERGDEPEDDSSGEEPPESPRDFVERKMREEEARQKQGDE
jgi:hypothetical protein